MSDRCWVVEGGQARRVGRDEARAARGQAEFVWLHLDGCEGGLDYLRVLDLPDIALEALSATETRPRTDEAAAGALINLRGLDARPDKTVDLLASIRMYVCARSVVSLSMRDLRALDRVDEEFANHAITDPGDLVWVLASAVTAELDPDVALLGDRLDDAEEKLFGNNALELRVETTDIRRTAIRYRRFLNPQREALQRLAAFEADWLREDDRQHLRQAADRGARMAEELEAIRERAALLHEQLTDLRAELLDTRSLILAIAAMIFLPLTFITGLFGMNVDGIPYQHHPSSFWVITGFCVAVALGVTGYFVWKRWSR